MQDPRIAVVGAGGHSTRRIYPFIGAAGGQLVGVCDLDLDKAERNARRFGGRAYTDLDAMLDTEHPDGVIVCIAPAEHARLALLLLRRGIPVYTEKPPAPDAASALEVARVARETGVLCTTAFKKRYATAYTRAREWLEGFPTADRYALSIDYASAQYPNLGPATSFLLDFAIHIIDLASYLFGDVTEVCAFANGEDAYAVNLRFRGGAVGSLALNDGRSFTVPTEEVEITLRGGNFMTIRNSSSWRITERERPVEWREPPLFTSAGDSGNETGHLAEIADFLAAIRSGKTSTRSSIFESYKTMVLYEAIRASALEHRIVPVVYEPV